jgi:hypothetical protein
VSALFSIVFEDVEQRQSSKDPAAASAGAAWALGDADEKIPQAWKLNLTGVKCCVGLEIRTRFHDASLCSFEFQRQIQNALQSFLHQ